MNCSDVREGFAFMYELDDSISDKYDFEEVGLKMHNKSELTVNIKYSEIEELKGREMENIAKEIGEMVNSLEDSSSKIVKGTVNFTMEKDYGVVTKSTTESFQMC